MLRSCDYNTHVEGLLLANLFLVTLLILEQLFAVGKIPLATYSNGKQNIQCQN